VGGCELDRIVVAREWNRIMGSHGLDNFVGGRQLDRITEGCEWIMIM
jgi:hypothetical protein